MTLGLAVSIKFPSKPHPLSDVSTKMMQSIECEGEAKFHSVTDMNCKQEGEVSDLDDQVGSYPSSNSLMVSKITQ